MAEKVVIEFEVDTATGEAKIKGLEDVINETGESTNEAGDAVGDLTDKLDEASGGAVSLFNGIVAGAKKGVASFKTLRTAVVATGIGALLVAVTSLASFFARTEEGAQALRVATAALGVVFDTVADVFVRAGQALFDLFTEPQEAIKGFADSIQNFVSNAISNVLDGVGLLGEALKELFDGNFETAFDKAAEGAKKLGDGITDLNPATAIAKQLGEAFEGLAENIDQNVRAAAELERRLNAVKVRERELNVERARSQSQIEALRSEGENVLNTEDERIEALTKAAALQRSLLDEELAIAKERLSIIQEQNALTASNEDDLKAEAAARARVFELEAEGASRARDVNNQLQALQKQAKDQELADLRELELARLTDTERQIEEVRSRYERLIELAKKYGQDTTELEQQLADRVQAIKDEAERKEQERLQREQDRKAKAAAKEAADEKRRAREAEQLAKEVTDTRIGTAQAGANAIASIAGEESEAAKGATAAGALIDTFAATIAAYKSGAKVSVVTGVLAAAAAGTFGLAQVKKILSTKIPNSRGGSSGGGSVGAAGPTAPPASQAIGLIAPNASAGDIGSNLSQELANQQPMRAFVVGEDVQNQEQLDNEIEANGSL